jgi:hypothetical protein
MTKGLKLNEPHRAELATAIAAAESARQSLSTARTAAGNAESRLYEAIGKLEDLRKLAPGNDAASQDHVLEALAAATPGFDILALSMPDADARALESKAENEIVAWRSAHQNAEKSIPDRQEAVEYADRRVDAAARAVIASSVDVGRLISEAEEAAASIVEKRIRLIYLRQLLDDEADRQAIAMFLSRPWLDEGSENWKSHPVVVQHRAAYDELLRDATAPLPE